MFPTLGFVHSSNFARSSSLVRGGLIMSRYRTIFIKDSRDDSIRRSRHSVVWKQRTMTAPFTCCPDPVSLASPKKSAYALSFGVHSRDFVPCFAVWSCSLVPYPVYSVPCITAVRRGSLDISSRTFIVYWLDFYPSCRNLVYLLFLSFSGLDIPQSVALGYTG